MYGYIYKTTNLVNGKIYVGQKKSEKFLGNNYLGSGKYLKCAIQHYGENNFEVKLLAEAKTKKELDELEKYYISNLNATSHDIGYNIANGAVGGDTYSNLSEEDKLLRNQKHSMTRRLNNKVYVTIHKGNDNKKIEATELNDYLSLGWQRGRSDDWEKKLSESHKGVKQSKEWVQKRVQSGWKNKSTEEYNAMIEKHRESAKRQMQNTPKEERIRRASNANKFKGKKCCFVHRGEERHFITTEELPKYLELGYSLGMLDKLDNSKHGVKQTEPRDMHGENNPFYGKHHTDEIKELCGKAIRGKIFVNDGSKEIAINPDELNSYLERGYKRGYIRNVKTK